MKSNPYESPAELGVQQANRPAWKMLALICAGASILAAWPALYLVNQELQIIPTDHAYYLEMRDRSGFDLDGNGQADRGAPAFASGFYTAYTDEAHGYGNAGTDNPPAQSPLDSQPEPGSDTPDLDDAARTDAAGDTHFSDGGDGWTDNYADPSSASR